MKKTSLALSVILCLSLLLPVASAIAPIYVTSEEIEAVESLMSNRGMETAGLQIEPLYNQYGEPAFLLGTTEDHYLIMSRNEFQNLENGEGNPYFSVPESQKKYYGGLLQYYIPTNNGYLDLVSNHEESEMLTTKFIAQIDNHDDINEIQSQSINLQASVLRTEYLPYASARIQSKAFGYNDDNTCTAVAVSLVLNYLDITYDNGIVPDNLELENLSRNVDNSVNAAAIKKYYPQAYAFHRTLADDCGIDEVSYADAVISGVENFSEQYMDGVEVKVDWNLTELPNNYVITSIDNDMPSMVTYTIFGDYSMHTMPAYGYRLLSDGSYEYLVHTGWYSTIRNNSNKQKMPMVWAPEEALTYLYKFTIK